MKTDKALTVLVAWGLVDDQQRLTPAGRQVAQQIAALTAQGIESQAAAETVLREYQHGR